MIIWIRIRPQTMQIRQYKTPGLCVKPHQELPFFSTVYTPHTSLSRDIIRIRTTSLQPKDNLFGSTTPLRRRAAGWSAGVRAVAHGRAALGWGKLRRGLAAWSFGIGQGEHGHRGRKPNPGSCLEGRHVFDRRHRLGSIDRAARGRCGRSGAWPGGRITPKKGARDLDRALWPLRGPL